LVCTFPRARQEPAACHGYERGQSDDVGAKRWARMLHEVFAVLPPGAQRHSVTERQTCVSVRSGETLGTPAENRCVVHVH
jgi:hypothetical protein